MDSEEIDRKVFLVAGMKSMKKIFISLIAALVVVCAMFYSLYDAGRTGGEEKVTDNRPRYHIQIVTKSSTNEHFWTEFKKGASDAGNKLNIYVEFVDVAQDSLETSVKTFEKAINSKVDGIALKAEDIEKTSALVNSARKKNIAVLTFENDHYFLPDIPTVGSNSYDIGCREGKMGANACGGTGCAAIIVNGSDEKESSQYKNLKLQGMMDAFSKYPDIKVQKVYTLESGMFETENLMSEILKQNSKINLILCTDERSTPGIAQVLVDKNRVGEVSVVGYGAMPQTLDYISHGVIYGSICPDSYHIGYDCVQQLSEMLGGGKVSDTLNTDLFSIDASNVEKYRVNSDGK